MIGVCIALFAVCKSLASSGFISPDEKVQALQPEKQVSRKRHASCSIVRPLGSREVVQSSPDVQKRFGCGTLLLCPEWLVIYMFEGHVHASLGYTVSSCSVGGGWIAHHFSNSISLWISVLGAGTFKHSTYPLMLCHWGVSAMLLCL